MTYLLVALVVLSPTDTTGVNLGVYPDKPACDRARLHQVRLSKARERPTYIGCVPLDVLR